MATTDPASVLERRRRRRIERLMREPWTARARRSLALRKELDRQGLITPHFSWTSYSCRDGTPVPDELRKNAIRLHWRLELLRHRLGDARVVVDGPYRTVERNRAVGGDPQSPHITADGAAFFPAQIDEWIAHGRATGRGAQSRDDVLRMASRTFSERGLRKEASGTLHVDARFMRWIPGR